ncbi:MAG TPA: MFS transporter [Acidimicrobiales bacterium]|nr:MFS transporter [Acidimicrobiales bacterium]
MKRFDPRRITAPYDLRPLAVLTAVSAVDGWDIAAFSVLTPEIRHAFHLSLAGVGVIAAVVAPVSILLTLPIAFLGDRRNRVLIAAAGLTVWAVATGLTGIAPVTAVLVIARMLARAGSDADTVHRSLLSDYYPPSRRGASFFAYDLGGTVGFLLAPVVAGFLSDLIGWRATFVVIIPVAILVAVFVTRLDEPRRGQVDREAVGVDAALAEVEEEPAGFGETMRVLRSYRAAIWVYLSIPLRLGAFNAAGLIFSTYLHDEFGLGSRGRGLVIGFEAPATIVSIVVTGVLVQRMLQRDENRRAMLLLVVLDGVSDLTILIMVFAPNIALAVFGDQVTVLLSAGVATGLLVALSLVVPPRMRTLAFASGALWALAGVPLLPAAGALADAHGTRVAFAALIVVALAGTFCLYMASRHLDEGIVRSRTEAVSRVEYRERRAAGDPVQLSVRDLVVTLSGTTILDHVSLDVADGEIVALLGTNGAGKTTLLRALTGLVVPNHGTLIFDGVELGGADPAKTFRLGMAYAPGAPYVFDDLTVRDNLYAAGWRLRRDRSALRAAVDDALALVGLSARVDVRAGELSGGERQLLNLAQAWLSQPRLLLLDELTLGLSPDGAERVLDVVRQINAAGTTVVFVEQSVDRALRLADRAVYLDRGQVRYDGPTAELRDNPDVLRAAFFGDAPARRRRRATATGASALEARHVSLRYGGVTAVDDVSLAITPTEIVAIVGPNGAGKTSLLDALAGAVRVDAGNVLFDGHDITTLPASGRARRGLGRSFQDARLWPALTVRDAIATARERHVTEPAFLSAIVGLPASRASEQAVADTVVRLLAEFGLTGYAERFVGELSTGMRRALELACLMAGEPRVLLLDEPAAGLAQREIPGVAARLQAVHERTGAAMVVVEHDLPLVRQIATRIVVMDRGRIIADGDPRTVFDLPEVQAAYFATARHASSANA